MNNMGGGLNGLPHMTSFEKARVTSLELPIRVERC